jgi:hypothetical protein
MSTLSVQQNQLSYVGTFERPPVELWGAGPSLLGGLLEVLTPFGTSIEGVVMDSTSGRPAEQAVVYEFGRQATYRFSLGSLKGDLLDFQETELSLFPEMIQKAEAWVREQVEEVSFKSHLYSYSLHASIKDETSEDVLKRISDLSLDALGTSRGAGITFQGDNPDGEDSRLQLALDHSLTLTHGLFVRFLWIALSDSVDHVRCLRVNRERFEASLAALDLELSSSANHDHSES